MIPFLSKPSFPSIQWILKTIYMTAMWTILMGEFSTPQDPQYLTRMTPAGSKFDLILPLESQGNKSTCLCNQRVKLSCLGKNGHLESNLGVFSAPQDPQYLTRVAPKGSKFYLILPLESKGNKSTCLCNQRVKLSCLGKNGYFESNLGVFSAPPGPPILDQDGPCGL